MGAEAATTRALTALDGFTFPFERGRGLLALGSVRRQAQQKGPARAALDEATSTFETLGARLWTDKARGELRRISGRRPADLQLTQTEHQVAVLAAQGRSNREIAASLHMGVSTRVSASRTCTATRRATGRPGGPVDEFIRSTANISPATQARRCGQCPYLPRVGRETPP